MVFQCLCQINISLSLFLCLSVSIYFFISVDGTPMDFWDFTGWPQIPQNVNVGNPKILTPHLMKYLNPYVKFILIFRQPSERYSIINIYCLFLLLNNSHISDQLLAFRLFSDYIFLKLGEPTAKAFHEKVLKSIKMFNNCCANNTVRACLFSRELQIKMPVSELVNSYKS